MSLGDLPTDDKGSTWALREDAEEAHDNLAPSTQQHVSTELTRSNLNTQAPLFRNEFSRIPVGCIDIWYKRHLKFLAETRHYFWGFSIRKQP